MGRLNYRYLALALAAGVGLFYLLTLRQGQGWMDDYAQYVRHAANLAEGRPYAEPAYIPNPDYELLAPATYPPVFPLLLAPVYKFAGPDLRAMKALTVFCFAAFLYLVWLFFRDGLGEGRALLAAALVGLNPVFWKFKDYLYAEYPFLLFSFAALYAWRRASAALAAGGRWLPRALAAGVLAYLAYGTRSAGLLLLPAFLAADVAALRRPSRAFWACCAAWLLPAGVQWAVLHSDAAYFGPALQLFSRFSISEMLAGNLLGYAERFTLLFGTGAFEPAGAALLAAAAALAAAGLARRARRDPLPAAYVALNAALLLAFPSVEGLRYAFPLVPFLFYYALSGWQDYGPRAGRAAPWLAGALLLAAALSYGGGYALAQRGSLREGTEKEETRQLFDFVRRKVPPGVPVIFRKPRTLAFYTGRPAAMYHFGPDAGVLAFFREIHAGYLVAGAPFPEDEAFLKPLVARNSKLFAPVYSNPDFTVYRLNP